MQVTNEMELIVLFVQESASTPNIEIISMTGSSFPDAVVKWNGIEYRVEFEYRASNFWRHRHNPADCDLIVCWDSDLPVDVLPTVSLQDEDWQSAEIVLVRDIEKTALYWKRRALLAESKMPESKMPGFIGKLPEPEPALEPKQPTDQEQRIVEMHQTGESRKVICEAVGWTPGGKQYQRIRAIVARWGCEEE